MSGKDLFHQWRDTASKWSGPADSFNQMHLAVLHQAERRKFDQHLLSIRFENNDFVLCEWKGRPSEPIRMALPTPGSETLWFCLQFHGKATFPGGHISQPETLFSFVTDTADYPLTLAVEKQWVLLLGVSGTSRQLLLAELPSLRELYDGQNSIGAAFPITFANRRLLEAFSKSAFGPFTTLHQIGQLVAKLYGAYAQQLEKPREPGGEESVVLLYHNAIDFLRKHYMDEDLNRHTVAAACNCSVRQLTRAFEGRSVTFNTAIRALRLHKARELLRKKPELSVEEIAVMVRFTDAKHLANYYKKQFHRSPREERKTIRPRT